MRRHILSVGILFFVGLFLTLPTTLSAQVELKEGMAQGDFALWLVKAVGAMSKLPPAGTGQDAIDFLTSLGIVPDGGWDKDEPITTELLKSLLGDPEDAEGLSFEELVEKVSDYVQSIFDERSQAVFPASGSGSASAPA